MRKNGLIDFGKQLLQKGRTPSEIYNALSLKASSKDDLNETLKQVFKSENKAPKRSQVELKKILIANNLKLNFEYSIIGLNRIAIVLLLVGGITLFLSNEEVNQNAVFGIITLIQAIFVTTLFTLVKYKKLYHLLIIAVYLYFILWIIELLIWGFPNDLLEVYNLHKINVPPNYKLKANATGARLIGFIFPFIYVGVKLFLGWFIFIAYWNYSKYDSLSNETKEELKKL